MQQMQVTPLPTNNFVSYPYSATLIRSRIVRERAKTLGHFRTCNLTFRFGSFAVVQTIGSMAAIGGKVYQASSSGLKMNSYVPPLLAKSCSGHLLQ